MHDLHNVFSGLPRTNIAVAIVCAYEPVQNTIIWRVDLGENNITDNMAPKIAQLLLENDSVRELDLSYNALHLRGFSAFIDVLAPAPTRVALNGDQEGFAELVLDFAMVLRDIQRGDANTIELGFKLGSLG